MGLNRYKNILASKQRKDIVIKTEIEFKTEIETSRDRLDEYNMYTGTILKIV